VINLPDSDKTLLEKCKQLEAENKKLQEDLGHYKNRCTHLSTYEHILQTTHEHISIIDRNYIYLAVSQSYLDNHSKLPEEIIGHTVMELLGEQIFVEMVKPNLEQCFNGHVVNYQAWFTFSTQGKRYMDVTYYPIKEQNSDEVYHVVVSAHDMTAIYQAQSDQRLTKSLFDNTSEGIVITDPRGTIVNINPAFTQISGYQKQEAIGSNANLTKSDRHDSQFYQQMWITLEQKGQWQGEIWDKHKDGQIYPKYLSINEVTDENDRVLNYVGIFSDISAMKDTQNQLEKLAYFDMLTRLPNRTHFFESLDHELAIAKRNQQNFAVFFIDLDGFKSVNDNFGHKFGDLLLKQVARRIKNCVRKTDFVARLGGDEFTVMLLNTNDLKQITQIANNITQELSRQFCLDKNKINIGASIGIFCYPSDGESIHSILSEADKAMYEAKKAGKGRYCLVSKT